MSEEMKAAIRPGAQVKVHETIREKDKERVSVFRGMVIARKHGSEPGATFTVRGRLGDWSLEKTYPVHSPLVAKVEVVSMPKKVRRAKLYFVRDLSAKKIRWKIRA